MKKQEIVKQIADAMQRRASFDPDLVHKIGFDTYIMEEGFLSVSDSIFDSIFPFHDEVADGDVKLVDPEKESDGVMEDGKLDYETWQEQNWEDLITKFAETGQDREFDFDLEVALESEYSIYHQNH